MNGGHSGPTWDDMMEDTERTVKALDKLYDLCLRQAGSIRNGGGNLRELENLLNKTVPVTEEDRRLAFTMAFLARVRRGSLIEYLFKIRRACLLLLIDGPAAVTALNVESCLDIWIEDDGYFRVARLSGPPGASGRSHEPLGSSRGDDEEARRRNRGRRNRGGEGRDGGGRRDGRNEGIRGGSGGGRGGGRDDSSHEGSGRGGSGRDGGGRDIAGRGEANRGGTGRGETNRGEANRGDANRGDANRGDANRGDANRGDANRGDSGRSDASCAGADHNEAGAGHDEAGAGHDEAGRESAGREGAGCDRPSASHNEAGHKDAGRGSDAGGREAGGGRDAANGREGGGRDGRGRGPPRGAVTGKPVMNMIQCHQVLASLGDSAEEPTSPASSSATAPSETPSYLAAATRGSKPASPRGGKSAHPRADQVPSEAAPKDTAAVAVGEPPSPPGEKSRKMTAREAATALNWADAGDDDDEVIPSPEASPKALETTAGQDARTTTTLAGESYSRDESQGDRPDGRGGRRGDEKRGAPPLREAKPVASTRGGRR